MPPAARALLVALALAACGGDDDAPPAADAGGPDAALPPALGRFPDDFLWGTAIAPYQVEGGLHASDWYQWESRCDTCSGDRADDGPDFVTHHADDLARAASLGHNAIRIGIDWSRIFPTAEQFPDA